MKTELKYNVSYGDWELDYVMVLKLPRKIKKDAKHLMFGDGYCFGPRHILNKYTRKLIRICDKQTIYFKIGSMVFGCITNK